MTYVPILQLQSFLSLGTLLGVAAPQFESHWYRDYFKRLGTKGRNDSNSKGMQSQENVAVIVF